MIWGSEQVALPAGTQSFSLAHRQTWHKVAHAAIHKKPLAEPEAWQELYFLSRRKRKPGPQTLAVDSDSRLHSCGCRLEAEKVFLGEPGTDGNIV